ncbi:MAG TPA: S8 family serine peptidase [Streptosporangiaceae bacterium]
MLTGGTRRLARRLAAAAAVASAIAAPLALAGPASADQARQRQQWVLNALDVPAAWNTTQGRGVTVAVIDSGVDPNVSDLTGQVTTGPDYTGVHTLPSNPNWGAHGTWMASLIAGHGHGPGHKNGILGVAPQSRILSVRVITDSSDPGHGAYLNEPAWKGQRELADAIRYAVKRRAGVISMSLGYQSPSLAVRAALQYALGHNVVVVASSGNSGATHAPQQHGAAPYSFPADYPGVIGVAAVNQAGQPAYFSSENLSVEVAAPGVNVPAQGRGSKYWVVSGTSPACALTAGVAALVRSKYPKLTAAQVRDAIIGSSTHRPKGGYDDHVGFGTVDAAAALRAAARLGGQVPGGQTQAGRRAAAGYFGGGEPAVPAFPVAAQGKKRLYELLGLGAVSLLVLIVALWWLVRRRRRRVLRPRPAFVPGPTGPLPGPGPSADPGPIGPDVRYPTQIFPARPFRQGRPAPGTVPGYPGEPGSGYPAAGFPGDGAPAGYENSGGTPVGGWPGGWPGAHGPGAGYPQPGPVPAGAAPQPGPWGPPEPGFAPQLPPGQVHPGLAGPPTAPPGVLRAGPGLAGAGLAGAGPAGAGPSDAGPAGAADFGLVGPPVMGPPGAARVHADDSDDWAFDQDEPAEPQVTAAAPSPSGSWPAPSVPAASAPAPSVPAPSVPAPSASAGPAPAAPAPASAPAAPSSSGPEAPQSDMDRWLADPLTSPRIPDSVLGRHDTWRSNRFGERYGGTDVTRPFRAPEAQPAPPAEPGDAGSAGQDAAAAAGQPRPGTADAGAGTPAAAATAGPLAGPAADTALRPGPAGLPRRSPGAQNIGSPGRDTADELGSGVPDQEKDQVPAAQAAVQAAAAWPGAGPAAEPATPAPPQPVRSVWEPARRPADGQAGRPADTPVWGRRTGNGGSQAPATSGGAQPGPADGGFAGRPPAAGDPAAASADGSAAAGSVAPGSTAAGAATGAAATGSVADASAAPEPDAAGQPATGSAAASEAGGDLPPGPSAGPGTGALPRRAPLAERGPLPRRQPFSSGQPAGDQPAGATGQSLWERPPSSARSSLWEQPAPAGLVPPGRPGTASRPSRLDRVALASEGSPAAARSSLWDRATPHPAGGPPGGLPGDPTAPADPVPATGPDSSGPRSSGPATTGPATAGPATAGPATTGPATTGPASTGPQSLPRRQPQTHLAAPLRRRPGGARVQSEPASTLPSVWDVRRPARSAGTDGAAGADGPDGRDPGA